MNKAHKKILNTVFSSLEEAKSQVEGVRDEMQEEFDNKSEKWQEGDKGQAFSQELDDLQSVADSLEGAMESIDQVKGEL